MGLLDGLRQALGLKAEADATRDADPDDLWGMSTAYVTMEADLDYRPTGHAALCFAAVDSTDFTDALGDVEAILEAGEAETGTAAEFVEDSHGYHWVVLEDDTFEDLVTSIHFAADTLIERDYGSRLLAALFAFEHPGDDRIVYWIYSFRRGAYYPFAPVPDERERDSGAEFKLQSVLDGELDVEDDKEYWYPLWPENHGYPWE
ncbi:MAG: hypothetical protein ABEI57_03200 [Halapricum sp.]